MLQLKSRHADAFLKLAQLDMALSDGQEDSNTSHDIVRWSLHEWTTCMCKQHTLCCTVTDGWSPSCWAAAQLCQTPR